MTRHKITQSNSSADSSRRVFLKQAGAAVAGMSLASPSLFAGAGASKKVRIGVDKNDNSSNGSDRSADRDRELRRSASSTEKSDVWDKDCPKICHKFTPPSWATLPDNPFKKTFERYNIPEELELDGFSLKALQPSDIKEDHRVITQLGNQLLLANLFGGTWPASVSEEDDLIDLCWHFNSFLQKRSFSWTIRKNGEYVGCAYYFPVIAGPGPSGDQQVTSAQLFIWFSSDAELSQLVMVMFYRSMYGFVTGDGFPKLPVQMFTPGHRQGQEG